VLEGVLAGADGRCDLRSGIACSAPELPPLGLPIPFVFHDEKAEDWLDIGMKVEMVEAGVNCKGPSASSSKVVLAEGRV
jgi:hypothetical protein